MQGYIKLHRQILDNTLFNKEEYSKGQAWIALLLLANFKDSYITVKTGELIEVKRGEIGWSMVALAEKFKWDRRKVKRFISFLETQKMVQQKIISNHSIISILNYDKYQIGTTDGTTDGTQTNNDKNDNNVEEVVEEEKHNIFTKFGNEYKNVYLKKEHYTRLLNACLSNQLMNELIEEYSINIERGKEKRFDALYPDAHYLGLMAYLRQRRKNPKIIPIAEPQSHYRNAREINNE